MFICICWHWAKKKKSILEINACRLTLATVLQTLSWYIIIWWKANCRSETVLSSMYRSTWSDVMYWHIPEPNVCVCSSENVKLALSPMWTHMWKLCGVCRSVSYNESIANHVSSEQEDRTNQNKVHWGSWFEFLRTLRPSTSAAYEAVSNVITHTHTQKVRENTGIQESFPVSPEREQERLYLGVSKITGLHLASAVIWDRTGGKERDERHRIKKILWKEDESIL